MLAIYLVDPAYRPSMPQGGVLYQGHHGDFWRGSVTSRPVVFNAKYRTSAGVTAYGRFARTWLCGVVK